MGWVGSGAASCSTLTCPRTQPPLRVQTGRPWPTQSRPPHQHLCSLGTPAPTPVQPPTPLAAQLPPAPAPAPAAAPVQPPKALAVLALLHVVQLAKQARRKLVHKGHQRLADLRQCASRGAETKREGMRGGSNRAAGLHPGSIGGMGSSRWPGLASAAAAGSASSAAAAECSSVPSEPPATNPACLRDVVVDN